MSIQQHDGIAHDQAVELPAISLARPPLSAPPASPGLSVAARRTVEGLGIPMTALPGVEAEDPVFLREHSRALNRLIGGDAADTEVSAVLEGHAGGSAFEPLRRQNPVSFSPLWDPTELRAVEERPLEGLADVWRERLGATERWAGAAAALRPGVDHAAVWREILGGDFDLSGRGEEYTRGMESFQASRWTGARTLLRLLGALGGRGVYLDVLGGDGYVWRLLEAEKRTAEPRLLLVRDEGMELAHGALLPADVRALALSVRRAHAAVSVLAVGAEAPAPRGARGEPRSFTARLLSAEAGGLRVSGAFTLSETEVAHLAGSRQTVEVEGGAALEERAAAALARAGAAAGDAVVVTNDISPHMFTRAGMWGMPTREDARSLSRTFHEASFDGVLFAYGTHHIEDMFAAAREARAVLRPGGAAVMHDFFDEGPAGQWFHRVVDKRSKTGHDFPHIGPVQMAVVLFAAGFRDVSLHEIQDPFLFACEEGEVRAREMALDYLLGMYGMAEGFRDGLGELEGFIHEILTYPEVGEVPIFGESFVYVPRRAVVARAVCPAGDDAPYSAADRALLRALAALFRDGEAQVAARAGAPDDVARYWFPGGGTRWGIAPEGQAAFLALADRVERAASARA